MAQLLFHCYNNLIHNVPILVTMTPTCMVWHPDTAGHLEKYHHWSSSLSYNLLVISSITLPIILYMVKSCKLANWTQPVSDSSKDKIKIFH